MFGIQNKALVTIDLVPSPQYRIKSERSLFCILDLLIIYALQKLPIPNLRFDWCDRQ